MKTTTTAKNISMFVFCVFISIIGLVSAFAAEDNVAIVDATFISQTPDPAQPGEYVDLRWRISNLGGAAGDFTFELIPSYPFTVDDNAKVTTNSIVGYQASADGVIVFYKVRVDSNAIEGSANTVRLAVYKTSNPSSKKIFEQAIRIESRQGLVDIGTIQVSPKNVRAGSPFNISIDINNLATNYISNVQVKVEDTDGFSPYGSSNQKTIPRIGGLTSNTIKFEYFVDAQIEAKVHTIPVTVTYTDSLGRDTEVETTIGVPVSADSEYFANLERTDIYVAGTKGKVVTSISNIGKGDINFVVLRLMQNDAYEILSTPQTYLGNLQSDDFETGQFDIYVNPTDAKSIPLIFEVQYRDAYDVFHTDTIVLENKLYTTKEAKSMQLVAAGGFGFGGIVIVLLIVGGAIYFWRRKKKK